MGDSLADTELRYRSSPNVLRDEVFLDRKMRQLNGI